MVAAALLALALPAAASALPAGPRLVFFEAEIPTQVRKVKEILGRPAAISHLVRLSSVDALGHDRRVPFTTPKVIPAGQSPFSWSIDGSKVAFVGQPIRDAVRDDAPRVYLANGDGSGMRAVPGTGGTSTAVLSPDGQSIAFDRDRAPHVNFRKLEHEPPKQILKALDRLRHGYAGQTTWIVPATGGKPLRLTRWQRGRFSLPTSFSPDGSLLAMTVRARGAKEKVETIEPATGKTRTIAVDAREAVFSPEGSRIAFTSFRDRESVSGFEGAEAVSELYVANADGGEPHRLTRTRRREESRPSWDPSGERIAYLRGSGGLDSVIGRNELIEANGDGSCPTVVAKPRVRRPGWQGSLHSPSWVPGEGRGAGPISC